MTLNNQELDLNHQQCERQDLKRQAARVLVIDDSALMRKHLRQIFSEQGFEVDTARNGEEGLEKIQRFDPNAVTLDINMPVMDGLTCLSLIMQEYPRPVIMLSSLTEQGALASFESLALGAFDYVAKPGGTVSLNIDVVSQELLAKTQLALGVKPRKTRGLRRRLRAARDQLGDDTNNGVKKSGAQKKLSAVSSAAAAPVEIVIIGVSTGGPSTVEQIVKNLKANLSAPIVIAQHMPNRFTHVFAERLNKITPLTVVEVNCAMALNAGHIYIAQGNADIKVSRRRGQLWANCVPACDSYFWHPSVDRLAEFVAQQCDPEKVIAVQLTGMGDDGARAITKLHEKGARTIAESEDSCVVYGMSRELVARGGASCILPSDQIAEQINTWII